jgi:outer membrane protein assembly factor BamB
MPISQLAANLAVVLLVTLVPMQQVGMASDWPQILGPNRNGKATDEKLASPWPAGGPPQVWQYAVGSGYAGVAAAQRKVVVWHRVGDECVADALDVRLGQRLWQAKFPTRYVSTIAPDNGPRCVPVIHQGQVFLVTPDGDLHCVALADGKTVWSRQAYADFDAPEGYFGAGSTPIVVDNKLIMNVGGRGAGMVAFAIKDGTTVWQATDEAASYAAPTLTGVAGNPLVIAVTRLNTLGIDPANGQVRWQYPFGMRGPTVNAATPLVLGDHLFLSASYGIGARWLKLAANQVDEVWESNDAMSSQYTTSIEHQGTLYGIDGRQDQGIARLRAIDPTTGKVRWTKEGFGSGHLIFADDKIIAQAIEGDLVLIDPNPKDYREISRFKALNTTAQALPALANGQLFVRDTNTLKCLWISKRPQAR